MFKIEILESDQNEYNEQYGKFLINSLHPGQGTTVGSALRRVLLTDLPGLAIVGLRIANINTEFSSLPGVREDILEIILNVKDIVIEGEFNSSKSWVLGRLKLKGPGVVTAALIEFEEDANIQIINPSQYIATIEVNSSIEMEFLVQTGKNYRLVESENSITYSTDFLQIDAIFMPVTKVAFEVTSTKTNALENNSSIQDNENLTLEIWTNGSISPIKALVFSASILENLATQLLLNGLKFCQTDLNDVNILDFTEVEEQAGWKNLNPNKKKLKCDKLLPLQTLSENDRIELTKYIKKPIDLNFNIIPKNINKDQEDDSKSEPSIEEKRENVTSNERNLSQMPIEELILSVRAYNGLKRANIHSVSDLVQYSIKDLKDIKNFGKKSLDEVVASLKNLLDITLI